MIIGITMIRDEADVIDTVLRHHLEEGVDHIIVSDNMSQDGTWDRVVDLLNKFPITLQLDDEPGFYQSAKMSRLAAQAHEMGAKWVLPFDADEIWYCPWDLTIGEALTQVPDEFRVVRAGGYDHLVSDATYIDSSDADEVVRYLTDERDHGPFSPWRRPELQPLVKVAFRPHPQAKIDMGNHGVTFPGSHKHIDGVLEFRHFQYRSLAQMTRKLRQGRAAYESTDLHPAEGTHWRKGGLLNDTELADEWAKLCATPGLVYDPAPIRVPVT